MTPLPSVALTDVLRRQAPLVGGRYSGNIPRGWLSPVQPRLDFGLVCEDPAAEEERWWTTRTAARAAGVVARAVVARLFRVSQVEESRGRVPIVSAFVDRLDEQQAIEEIFERPPGNEAARVVHFVHPHALNLATFDGALRRQLSSADVVLPDGVGIRLAGRLLGTPVPRNLNGTDLLPVVCREAIRRRRPLALVGGAPGIAQECAARLEASHPGLEIAYVHHGYLDEASHEEVIAALSKIEDVLVLVGMGSPRQEAWSWKAAWRLPRATLVTVGGLFDFYAERVARAPLAWRELGLEWVFRLLMEPRRLALRYLVGNPLFLTLVLAQRLGLLRTRSH